MPPRACCQMVGGILNGLSPAAAPARMLFHSSLQVWFVASWSIIVASMRACLKFDDQ